MLRYALFKPILLRGTWVARSVKYPTLAQVMILWSVSSSPTLGSVLTAWSQLRILRLSLSAPLLLTLCLSLSLSKINIKKNKTHFVERFSMKNLFLSNAFSFIKMIIWVLIFILVKWCIILFEWQILNCPCMLTMNPTWWWWVILSVWFWMWLANIFWGFLHLCSLGILAHSFLFCFCSVFGLFWWTCQMNLEMILLPFSGRVGEGWV